MLAGRCAKELIPDVDPIEPDEIPDRRAAVTVSRARPAASRSAPAHGLGELSQLNRIELHDDLAFGGHGCSRANPEAVRQPSPSGYGRLLDHALNAPPTSHRDLLGASVAVPGVPLPRSSADGSRLWTGGSSGRATSEHSRRCALCEERREDPAGDIEVLLRTGTQLRAARSGRDLLGRLRLAGIGCCLKVELVGGRHQEGDSALGVTAGELRLVTSRVPSSTRPPLGTCELWTDWGAAGRGA